MKAHKLLSHYEAKAGPVEASAGHLCSHCHFQCSAELVHADLAPGLCWVAQQGWMRLKVSKRICFYWFSGLFYGSCFLLTMLITGLLGFEISLTSITDMTDKVLDYLHLPFCIISQHYSSAPLCLSLFHGSHAFSLVLYEHPVSSQTVPRLSTMWFDW